MDTRKSWICFVYDRPRSLRERRLTVRLALRKHKDGRWIPEGPRRTYYADDLSRLGERFPDPALLRTALQSEMANRRIEGRLASANDELTRLRVVSDRVVVFLERAIRTGCLITPEGDPLRLESPRPCPVSLRFDPAGEDRLVCRLFIGDREYSRADFATDSTPVAAFFENAIRVPPDALSKSLLDSIPAEKTLSPKEADALADRLSGWTESLSIRFPSKEKTTEFSEPPAQPCLDIHPDFQRARLDFEYPGPFTVRAVDKRPVVRDTARNMTLYRNLEEEKFHARTLKKAGARFQPEHEWEWYLPSSGLERRLGTLEDEGFALRVEGKPLRACGRDAWNLKLEGSRLCLAGGVHFDRREASAADVWRAARSGRRTAPLSDDSLGLIPAAWFKRIRELDLDAVPERTRVLFDSRNVAPLESLLNTASKLEMEDSARRLFDFHKGRIEGGALEIPPTLRGVLRPYQEKGFFWMEALHRYAFSGILADDMGLGKTVQVLALLEAIRLKTPEKRCLLVVPTSLIHNWELEIRRFTPGLQAHVHAGTKQERSPHAFGESFLVITSYALLRIDCRYFRPVPWHYVVLDESQAIKNPDARITASVKSLHAEHRLSLTGTPVENRAEDLWSQFDFLMPGFLGDRSAFRRGRGGPEPEGLESLARRCRPFLLRRTKDGVLDELPPKTEVPLFCEFEPEQRALYVRTLAETRRRFRAESDPADPGSSRTLHLLEAILRLRQIACHPALSGAEGADSLESGKHEQVMETAREILSEGHKILIFSQFARHLKLLRTRFRKEGIPSHYLDGATRDRAGVIHAFKNDPRPSVFFLSLKAGGQGLNLTEASYVFLLDPWWNPAVENQAMDRCHRMGQKRPVTVYRFLTRDSIEEKVVALQDKKRELETALVHASGESMDLPLDREALEKLLEI